MAVDYLATAKDAAGDATCRTTPAVGEDAILENRTSRRTVAT